MKISIAHSPDSDDYFLFWALRERKLSWLDYDLHFHSYPTHELNDRACAGLDDITAISLGSFPRSAEQYRILSSGASVGRNYGPVLVTTKERSLESLENATIAIPGQDTTAAKVLTLCLPQAKTKVISIEPYTKVIEALRAGVVDAAVLIHEAQLLYQNYQLHYVLDLGKWWHAETRTPLVLGINVIRTQLGDAHLQALTKLTEDSVQYAFDHPDEVTEYLAQRNATRTPELAEREQIKLYLSKYANQDSLRLPADCKESVELFLNLIGFTFTPQSIWA